MENKIIYVKRKRERIGKCNICGKISELTNDHVPPKCWYNSQKIEYKNVFNGISNTEKEFRKSNISQNGIKFRNICADCNNRLLGRNYDVELDKWVDNLKNILLSDPNDIEKKLVCEVKINKITRAIAGHLLAAKNTFDEDNKIDVGLREYFLDEAKMPPQNMKLLWRLYPYSTILLIRDIATQRVTEKKTPLPNGLISCLSAFPIAIILAKDCDNTCGLDDLFSFCTNNIEETIELFINMGTIFFERTNKLRPMMWPCNISDQIDGTDFILCGATEEDSIMAFRDKAQLFKIFTNVHK